MLEFQTSFPAEENTRCDTMRGREGGFQLNVTMTLFWERQFGYAPFKQAATRPKGRSSSWHTVSQRTYRSDSTPRKPFPSLSLSLFLNHNRTSIRLKRPNALPPAASRQSQTYTVHLTISRRLQNSGTGEADIGPR